MRWPLNQFTITTQPSNVHMALDMAAPSGTPVLAAVTGTVIQVGTDPNYIGGRYVIIREDMADHWEFYTGHHSQTLVSVGQRVTEGQHIADVGMTGQATGPHVHFQIRTFNYGGLLNPYDVYNSYPHNTPQGGNEVANAEQVKVIYRAVLRREGDAGGVQHYTGQDANFIVQDMLNSQEHKNLDASIAAKDVAISDRDRVIGELQGVNQALGTRPTKEALQAAMDQVNAKVMELDYANQKVAAAEQALADERAQPTPSPSTTQEPTSTLLDAVTGLIQKIASYLKSFKKG